MIGIFSIKQVENEVISNYSVLYFFRVIIVLSIKSISTEGMGTMVEHCDIAQINCALAHR